MKKNEEVHYKHILLYPHPRKALFSRLKTANGWDKEEEIMSIIGEETHLHKGVKTLWYIYIGEDLEKKRRQFTIHKSWFRQWLSGQLILFV